MPVSVNNIPIKVYDDILNGIGKTTEQLMQKSLYTNLGWNFNEIWTIEEGKGYPTLLMEKTVNPIKVVSIHLNYEQAYLKIGESLTLIAEILPENASEKTLTWASSDTAVAEVSDAGVVFAKGLGVATITAKTTDGTALLASCQISVITANISITDAESKTSYFYIKSGENLTLLDNLKKLSINESIIDINLTYTRNFSNAMVGNWQAWYMPCDVDYDDLSDEYDVAMVAGVLFDKEGENYVAFKKMTDGTVKAHTPYVVRAKSAGDVTITTTTTLEPTSTSRTHSVQSSFHNFIFSGLFENTILTSPSYALNENGVFAKLNEGSTLNPFRIKLLLTDREDNPYVAQAMPQEVKILILGEETGIAGIDADVDADVIYNLGGQKLSKPQKGINIVNGKKVLF